MPNPARQFDPLPPGASLADQAAQLGITPAELRERLRQENIAARANPAPKTSTAGETFTEQRKHSGSIPSAFSIGALPFDEPTILRPIALTLPWSTLHSINGTWTIRSTEYQSAKGRAREAITEQLFALVPAEWIVWTCAVAVDVVLVVPDKRPRDLDNYEKLIYDALKGLVYRDDSLIDDKRIRRALDVDRPRAEITVTPIGAKP